MNPAIPLTSADFEAEVLRSETPVLVDYWAPWCGWCRKLAPVIDAIAAEREGTLKVGTVDTDAEPLLAQLAGVQGIPAVLLFRDGKPVASALGAQPKAALERALGLDVVAVVTPPRA